LEEKIAAPVKKLENTAVGIRRADHAIPLNAKFGINFANK
jgi:hypothetical protein